MAYQPHSSMTVSVAFVADVNTTVVGSRGVCAGWEDFCFLFSLFTASCSDLWDIHSDDNHLTLSRSTSSKSSRASL